jgi:hypothetical protein
VVSNEPRDQDQLLDPSLQYLERHQQGQRADLLSKFDVLERARQDIQGQVERLTTNLSDVGQQLDELERKRKRLLWMTVASSVVGLIVLSALGWFVYKLMVSPSPVTIDEKVVEGLVDRRIQEALRDPGGTLHLPAEVRLLYTPDLYANGKDKTSIVVTVIGDTGQPVEGEQVHFQILDNTDGRKGQIQETAVTDKNGQVVVTFTAGTIEGIVEIEVSCGLRSTLARVRLTPAPDLALPVPTPVCIDQDEDGLTDSQESILGTASDKPDTDGDYISDWEEALILRTDPLRSNLRSFAESVQQRQIWLASTLGGFEVLLAEAPTSTVVFELERNTDGVSYMFIDLWARSTDPVTELPGATIITGTASTPTLLAIGEDPSVLESLSEEQPDPAWTIQLWDETPVQILPVSSEWDDKYVRVRIRGWVKTGSLTPLVTGYP